MTHHHADHVGGLCEVLRVLRARGQAAPPAVYKAPHTEARVALPACVAAGDVALRPLADGATVAVPGTRHALRVLATRGHTSDSGYGLVAFRKRSSGNSAYSPSSAAPSDCDMHPAWEAASRVRARVPYIVWV